MSSPDVLRARLFLSRAVEPPAPAVHHFVAVHGPVDAVSRIRNGAAPAAVLSEVARQDPQVEDDLRAIDNGTARLLVPEDEEWPLGRLSALVGYGVPLALWLRGNASLAELTNTAVTITGSRASSAYGNTIAAHFGSALADAGAAVVSGGSLGVDEAAHHGALAANGPTVVVLPCGVDRTYPRQHVRLYEQIVDQGGLLVSEYSIGAVPIRARFRARCRLLAALTAATVIVEAGRRSGALTVAGVANDLGRRVYGVPGPIHSATSTGVNELLRVGTATVMTSLDHVHYRDGLR
ncbi:DNA-processing protein DprA [Lentzea miocenica]|uniref:DNA-processing protein DprA n=1 Tax=Lentzea miocenica TaxID=3095431 RepID=UPI0029F58FE5|nr:DNA-processing protein DprA [Lentzea sp. BCCO 10_0856]